MTTRVPLLALAATLSLLGVTPAAAQNCPTVQVAQESYDSISDLVYLYAPNIMKSPGGWRPFTVRVLVGQYRRPLLLKRGFMKEADVDKLLSGRPDITSYPLQVAGYSSKGGRGNKTTPGQPVGFKDQTGPMTIRFVQVVPAADGNPAADAVLLEVCRK